MTPEKSADPSLSPGRGGSPMSRVAAPSPPEPATTVGGTCTERVETGDRAAPMPLAAASSSDATINRTARQRAPRSLEGDPSGTSTRRVSKRKAAPPTSPSADGTGTPGDDRLLDTRAAAAFLQVAPRTLYKWASQGRLPVVRLGRAVRFRMSALRTLVREHEEPAIVPLGGVVSPLIRAGTERALNTRP